MMRRLFYILVCVPILLLTGCDVHEWPSEPDVVRCRLQLTYETNMTEWEHVSDKGNISEIGNGSTYDNKRNYGQIRYIVRAYPISSKQRASRSYTHEFVFTKDLAQGYDHEVVLDLYPGDYNIMVWSDLVLSPDDEPYYDATDFQRIGLSRHVANDDYRDAFRGLGIISLKSDVVQREPDGLEITMQRPLAKFEFITNDVLEFIEKESARIAAKINDEKAQAPDKAPSRAINIEDYKIVFSYVRYMPNEYSVPADVYVGSKTNIFFESTLKRLSSAQASLGFEYVFVNQKQTSLLLQISIFDKEGVQLSVSDPIEVPLKRDHHTVMAGMFLMSEASGGVTINPGFDNDHNIPFP